MKYDQKNAQEHMLKAFKNNNNTRQTTQVYTSCVILFSRNMAIKNKIYKCTTSIDIVFDSN